MFAGSGIKFGMCDQYAELLDNHPTLTAVAGIGGPDGMARLARTTAGPHPGRIIGKVNDVAMTGTAGRFPVGSQAGVANGQHVATDTGSTMVEQFRQAAPSGKHVLERHQVQTPPGPTLDIVSQPSGKHVQRFGHRVHDHGPTLGIIGKPAMRVALEQSSSDRFNPLGHQFNFV